MLLVSLVSRHIARQSWFTERVGGASGLIQAKWFRGHHPGAGTAYALVPGWVGARRTVLVTLLLQLLLLSAAAAAPVPLRHYASGRPG